MKNILIIDDDTTSLKYKKWLEDEGIFNLTLLSDPLLVESHLKSNNIYDLILIGLKISITDGLNLYAKINKISITDGLNLYAKINKITSIRKVEHVSISKIKEFRVCFMTSSMINFNALSELYPELEIECYVPKEVSKEVFMKHILSVLS